MIHLNGQQVATNITFQNRIDMYWQCHHGGLQPSIPAASRLQFPPAFAGLPSLLPILKAWRNRRWDLSWDSSKTMWPFQDHGISCFNRGILPISPNTILYHIPSGQDRPGVKKNDHQVMKLHLSCPGWEDQNQEGRCQPVQLKTFLLWFAAFYISVSCWTQYRGFGCLQLAGTNILLWLIISNWKFWWVQMIKLWYGTAQDGRWY